MMVSQKSAKAGRHRRGLWHHFSFQVCAMQSWCVVEVYRDSWFTGLPRILDSGPSLKYPMSSREASDATKIVDLGACVTNKSPAWKIATGRLLSSWQQGACTYLHVEPESL